MIDRPAAPAPLPEETPPERPGAQGRVSRRLLLGATGAAAVAGGANGVVAGMLVEKNQHPAPTEPPADAARLAGANAISVAGDLPAGLAEAMPAFGNVVALDLSPAVRSDPSAARKAAVAFLTRLAALSVEAVAPTGADAAALDLFPSNFQLTPGFGASLLTACGLADKRPEAFVDLPAFTVDKLDPALCGGDVLVQVGAEDPMRLAGALQRLYGLLGDDVVLRWSRSGFRSTAAAKRPGGGAARNLMGHHDGSANPVLGSPLWDYTVRSRSADWMRNGSYVVARDIAIDLGDWFTRPVDARDRVIGRSTATGAPLGGQLESDPADLSLKDATGAPTIPADAHLRLANQANTGGARIYRRPWNYDDGFGPDGKRRAGLMFLAWQNDLRHGFIPIQQSLDQGHDALSAFITHIGSAVFAVPAQGRHAYVGQDLFEG